MAAEVSKDLAEEFRSDFERGMDRFWKEHNTKTTPLLREMARFFLQFEPSPGNAYLKLLSILGGTRRRAVLVTTNYDLLIEHAINRTGFLITYGAPAVDARNVPLLKIHGSCNFVPDLGGGSIRDVSFDLGGSTTSAILEAGIRPCDPIAVAAFLDKNNSVAPALAMYSPSKQVLYCPGFVKAQHDAWLAALRTASRIYVIGLRVHEVDSHIWGPLAQARAPLYYVGQERADFLGWARKNGRRSAYHIADTFQSALPRIAKDHGSRARAG